jgi:PLP dependent protein
LERIERLSDVGSGVLAPAVTRELQRVRERIAKACERAGRSPADVTILAVTKGFGPEAIEAALAAGLTDIGENYVQEAERKFSAAAWPSGPVRRHFIGHVQSNKARRVAALFDMVQTIDAYETATKLDAACREGGRALDVLVQVNVAGDTRAGVAPDDAASFARSLGALPSLRVRGMMAVGPADPSAAHDAFATARRTFHALHDAIGADVLSLGMSGDLESAIAAGSTMVRLGTALFGARPAKG